MSDFEPEPPAATPYTPSGAAVPPPSPLLSIFSLVGGILGLVVTLFIGLIPFVGGILGLLISGAAVVLGHLGQRRERPARGFWLTGLITGYIGVGLALISLVFWIVLFSIVAAHQAS